MGAYKSFSKKELIAKITELEKFLDAMQQEKNNLETLDFPWVGNLGSWYWYPENNRVIFNEQKVTALGYSREEIPENVGFEFFTEKLHPDDYERVMDNMRNHLNGKTPAYETSYRIRTKQNTWAWFYDRGKVTMRNPAGKPELVAGIVFDITEQKRVESLLEQQNRQLLELSTIDYLTGVFNRRVIFEKLEVEIARARRYDHPLSILILDVDHFKQINDTLGHLMGDKILVQIANNIRTMIRSTDSLGRYGGEEFLVILPESTEETGRIVAEKIRTGIEQSDFESNLKITVSGGLVQFNDETMDELIERADKYLYAAKNNGRNWIESPSK